MEGMTKTVKFLLLTLGATAGFGCDTAEHDSNTDELALEASEDEWEVETEANTDAAEGDRGNAEPVFDPEGILDGLQSDDDESALSGLCQHQGYAPPWAASCGPTQFCAPLPMGHGCHPLMGTCVTQPSSCPPSGATVCGCDGQNYSSQCHAHAAGISVAYLGSCQGDLD